MSRLCLPFLETMITQVCNLSCTGCTNYSDLRSVGYVTWAQGKAQLESWLSRIDIPDFGIMGGEPLINPEVMSWITGVRQVLPQAQIRFTTNGLLMHRWPELIPVLHSVGNCVFKISVHTDDAGLEDAIKRIFDLYHWEPITEHGINRWITSNNMRFQINRPTAFVKTYRNEYHDMMPYHSDPAQAFDVCIQQTCPLLYQGKIYKCSTAGLLESTLERFDRPNWDQWEPYLDPGIDPDCSQESLEAFIGNFGKPSKICAQCPDSLIPVIDHKKSVRIKRA